MKPVSNMREYIRKQFPGWEKTSKSAFGRYVDPREPRIHDGAIKVGESWGFYRSLTMDQYLDSIEKLESLATDPTIRNISQLADRLRGITWMRGELAERINQDPRKYLEGLLGVVGSKVDSQKAKNRCVADNLLTIGMEVSGNMDIPIFAPENEVIDYLMSHQILKSGEYSFGERTVNQREDISMLAIYKTGERRPIARFQKQKNPEVFSSNVAWFMGGGGGLGLIFLPIIRALVDVVRDNKLPAHFAANKSFANPIEGVFYDPAWK